LTVQDFEHVLSDGGKLSIRSDDGGYLMRLYGGFNDEYMSNTVSNGRISFQDF
jgi:hypothetical protein